MVGSDAVFIDTSGWIAMLSIDDGLHASAMKLLQEFAASNRPLVTTDWVIAESGNGLARTAARTGFAGAVRSFLGSPAGQLIRIDEDLFHRAVALYEQSRDKTWGLIDCASFVVMREQGISEALTADRHFPQAGFRCLLPGKP